MLRSALSDATELPEEESRREVEHAIASDCKRCEDLASGDALCLGFPSDPAGMTLNVLLSLKLSARRMLALPRLQHRHNSRTELSRLSSEASAPLHRYNMAILRLMQPTQSGAQLHQASELPGLL